VRTHSPLVVDVHELLEAPGSRRSVRLVTPVAGLGDELVGAHDDLTLDLVLEAIDGGLVVQGSISGAYSGVCRRCLEPVSVAFDTRVAEVYRPAGGVWEEGYAITPNNTVDLELVVRDNVGLEVPLNPLCRPDCAGLCSRCGANLNEGPCGCPEEVDPRWSALQELGKDQTGKL
jgi:uncharacterized protein